jgi:two-component system NtrC family sensor kinase
MWPWPSTRGFIASASVHVGLYKKHIDQLINKLRTTFLGFVSVVILFFFIISHYLSKTITQPITRLTKVSDEISRGIFDVQLDPEKGIQAKRASKMKCANFPDPLSI